jgi:hypothetical protein
MTLFQHMRLFVSFILLLSLSVAAYGQEEEESKWFIRAHVGYGFATGGSYRPSVVVPASSPFTTTSNIAVGESDHLTYNFKKNRKGLGSGFRTGLGIGYIVNDIVNVGIDLEQYWSPDLKVNLQHYRTKPYLIQNTSHSIRSNMLSLTPNVTLKVINNPLYYFYMRLGLSIGIAKKLKENINTDIYAYNLALGDTVRSVVIEEYKYTGGIPLGYTTAAGIQAKISGKIRLFFELQANFMSFAPKKRTMTSYVSSSGGILENQKKNETEIEFTNDGSDNGIASQPAKRPKISIPYSSLGFNFGIGFRL